MQGSLDQPPILFTQKRSRVVPALLICAAMFALALVLPGRDLSTVARWLLAGFFGLLTLALLGGIISPARLEIAPSGLTVHAAWRTRRYPWDDVYNFNPRAMGRRTTVIGFDVSNAQKRSGLVRLNAALGYDDGALVTFPEISAQALADLLNQARERWLSPATAAAQSVPVPQRRSPVLGWLTAARIDRKAFWISTGVLFSLAICVTLLPGKHAGTAVFTALFVRIYAARLHDFGRSGWWQLLLYGMQIPVIILISVQGHLPLNLALLAALLIQLTFTAVLGAVPGDPGPNKFGPAPGEPSPIAASEVFR